MELKKRYLIDEDGNRLGVVLDIKDYRSLLEELEELETLRAYDAAKASDDEVIPFEQAVAEIDGALLSPLARSCVQDTPGQSDQDISPTSQ